MKAKLNLIFYIALATSFVIFLLPPRYKMAVYTPNLLGFFDLLVCWPTILVTFVWLGILDIRHRTLRSLAVRMVVFVVVVLGCVLYFYYRLPE